MGSSLGTLLKHNLIKGSLATGSGVFMHDIVRDYVINQHSKEELCGLQKSVAATLLAARPEPGGFVMPAFAGPATFEGYIARQMHWHFSGAAKESEEPPDSWMRHPDNVILMNVAGAVGAEKLAALAVAREEAGLAREEANIARQEANTLRLLRRFSFLHKRLQADHRPNALRIFRLARRRVP